MVIGEDDDLPVGAVPANQSTGKPVVNTSTTTVLEAEDDDLPVGAIPVKKETPSQVTSQQSTPAQGQQQSGGGAGGTFSVNGQPAPSAQQSVQSSFQQVWEGTPAAPTSEQEVSSLFNEAFGTDTSQVDQGASPFDVSSIVAETKPADQYLDDSQKKLLSEAKKFLPQAQQVTEAYDPLATDVSPGMDQTASQAPDKNDFFQYNKYQYDKLYSFAVTTAVEKKKAEAQGKTVDQYMSTMKRDMAKTLATNQDVDPNTGVSVFGGDGINQDYMNLTAKEFFLKAEMERLKSVPGYSDDNYFGQKYREYEKQYNEFRNKRFSSVDAAVSQMEKMLERNLTPSQRSFYENKLNEYKAMRGDFFSPVPTFQEVKDNVSSNSIGLLDAAPAGLSEKEKFELWYKSMYDEYITLHKEYGGAFDAPKDFLSQVPGLHGFKDEDRDRYYELRKDLTILGPLFFLNSNISQFGNEPGFAASAIESAMTQVSPNVEGTKSTKYADRNALTLSILNDIGVDMSKVNQAQVSATEEQSVPDKMLQSDFTWYNPISWVTDFDADRIGEMTGTTAGIMIPIMFTKGSGLGSLQKGLSAIDKVGKATSLEAAYVSSFVNSKSKIARSIGKALDEAYTFEMAGNLFSNNEDQLNFAAGFGGAILGQAVEPILGSALSAAASEKAALYTKRILGDRGVKAIAASVDKAGAVTSRAIGETGQELGEELTNIWMSTENGQSFLEALNEQFPNMEAWQEFLAGSFIMGAGFGYGSSMDVFKKKYNDLSEEQKTQIKPIVAELLKHVTTSVASSVSKVASDPEVQKELSKEEQQTPVTNEQEVQAKGPEIKPSPNKEAFDQSVRESFEGKATEEQIGAALSIAEARAKVWSKQTGKDIDEWYSEKSAQESNPEDLLDQPVLYQFVGENSNLTQEQKTSLSTAKKLQSSGSDSSMIWQNTGWYFDRADDKWKTEVPGQDNVVFKPTSNDAGEFTSGTKKLSEVIEWNELFEAHPELKDIEVEFQVGKDSELGKAKALGYADLTNNKVAVKLDDIARSYMTLRHEIQHFIQKKEAFQPGSAPEDFKAAGYPAKTAKKIYTMSSGEVEANNVMERSLLSEEERQMLSPEETMMEIIDINPGDRVVLDAKADNGWVMSINTVNRKLKGLPAENRNVDLTKKLAQGEKGAIEFGDNSSYVIHAFESADITTLIHELFHGFRRDIYDARENAVDQNTKSQLDEDIKALEAWAGVTDGNWDVKAEEKVARAGERYMREGKAPSPELKPIFERMKDWFTEIYSALKGSPINIKIDEDVRGVFDRMFAEKKAEEKKPANIKEKFKNVADATRKLKMPEQFMADMAGAAGANKILLKAWDGMIEVAAKTIEATGSVAQAVSDAIGYFQTTDYFKSLPEQAREKAVRDMKDFITKELKKIADPVFEDMEDPSSGRTEQRKTAESLLSNDKELTEQAKAAVDEIESYVQRSRSINEQEAKKIVDDYGVDVATTIAMNKKNGLDAAVRITLASMIVVSSEQMAKDLEAKGDQVAADRIRERSGEMTNFIMKFATELGRGIDALKILNNFSAKQYLSLINIQNSKIRENIEKNREKINEFINLYNKAMNNIVDGFDKTVNESHEKVTGEKSVPKNTPKAESTNIINKILKEGINDQIIDKISSDYNVDKSTAEKIAKDVVDTVIEKKNKASSTVQDNVPVVNRKLRKAISDILGEGSLMTREEIEDIIKKEYGIKEPDKDFISYIESLQNKLQNLTTDAAKKKVAVEIMKALYNYSVSGSGRIKRSIPVPPSELMWSMWYANTLSSVDTQLLNFNANAIKAMVELPINSLLALTPRVKGQGYQSGGIRVGKNKLITYPDIKRAVSIWKAFFSGVGTKGLTEAASTMAYGPSSTIRSDLTGIESVVNPLEDVRYKGGSFNPINYLKYVGRAMSSVDEIFFSGAESIKLYEILISEGRYKGLKGQALNDYVNEKMGYTKKQWAETMKQAAADVEADMEYMGETYSPVKKKAMQYRRAWEIWENQVDAHYIERAKNYGRKFTYNYKPQGLLGVVAGVINDAAKKVPPIRLVVPFTKVVANVFNEMLGYTPFGIPGVIRENEREEQARAALKVVVGSSLLAAIALAYDDDDDSGFKIYGKGPADWDQQAQLRETGWLPYSIKIGDKYYSYQFSPLFAVLSFAGNTADFRRWNDREEMDIMTETAYTIQRSGAGMLEQSYLTGLNGFLSGLVDNKGDMKSFEKTVGNITRPLSGFIPWKGLLSNIDRETDKTVYRRDDLLAMIASSVPFVRRLSGEKLNSLGEPIKYGDRFSQEVKEHPVYSPLIERGIFIPDYNKGQEFPDGTKITNDEYWNIIKTSGTEAKDFLISTGLEKIKSMSDTQAQEYVNKVFSRFRKKALIDMWMNKNGVKNDGDEFNDAIMVRESSSEFPETTKLY